MTLTLLDGDLALTITPERGAEACSLEVDGVELLYQAPWPPQPLPPDPVDATPWELAWHGGWQLLWPNAGSPCTVGGVEHGFHGAGSIAPFEVIESAPAHAMLRCAIGGLVCERSFEVRDGAVRASARIRNESTTNVPLIVVEHLILGGALAVEGTSIELAGGHAIGQSWDGVPLLPGEPWPELAGDDLSILPGVTSRFVVVRDLAAGEVHVTSPTGLSLDVRFDRSAFPHLWLWEERLCATVEPWSGRGECLAIEPSSVPSTDGLGGAVERGEAIVLLPGESFESWCELAPRPDRSDA